jgi:FkbM family methyltransferase
LEQYRAMMGRFDIARRPTIRRAGVARSRLESHAAILSCFDQSIYMDNSTKLKPLLSDRQRALLARLLKEQPKQQAIDFYSQFVGAGDLCFDVGANVGSRIGVFAKLGASVVAIEPQSECIHLLKMIHGANPNVHLLHKALGDEEGRAELSTSSFSTVSSLSKEWREGFRQWESPNAVWDGSEQVEITTLDRVIQQFGMPMFVKIDVEGYELQVLKGLTQAVPALSFEFHTFHLDAARDCICLLSDLGPCVMNYNIEEHSWFMSEQWLTPAQMVEELSRHEHKPPWYGEIFTRFTS